LTAPAFSGLISPRLYPIETLLISPKMTIPDTKSILPILFILIFPPSVYAKNIIVARDGSGNHTSIKEALKAAHSGDTIYVRAGEYEEGLRIKQDNITLKGAGFTKTRLIAKDSFPIKLKGIKGFVLEGFFIKALTKQGHSAVLISDSEAVIRHCLITSGPDGYGIFCNKGTKAAIEHNTIVGNRKDGGIRLDKSCNLVIKNNIIVNNSFGVNNKDKTGTVRISHNNVWGNGRDYVNCRPAGNNISLDPRFINPKAEDYRLSASSPCLGAGEKGADMGPSERIKLAAAEKTPPSPTVPVTKPKLEPKPKPEPEPEPEPELTHPPRSPRLEVSYELVGADQGTVKADGEASLSIRIKNSGTGEAKGVKLEISPSSPSVKPVSQELGAIGPHEEKRVQLSLSIDPQAPTQKVELTLRVSEQQGRNPAPQNIILQLKGVPATARLKLDSQPQGARVYLDGKSAGETPLSIPSVVIGEHRLRLTLYIPEAVLQYETPVVIKPGDNQLKITRFEHIAPPADMVYVPAGEFEMGSNQGDADQQPAHRVYLDAFYIDQYEVTNARYEQFVRAKGRKPPMWWGDERFRGPQQPVVGITWEEAAAYCRWLDKRLPTEAEWEKAARGTRGRLYPWGDNFVYGRANIVVPDDGYEYTAPVGSYPGGASPYGALDMAGNVAEWCADWYAADYYQHSPRHNPQGPANGEYRVVRGGSWNGSSYEARSTHRWRYFPDTPRSYIGFRCLWQP
jgi:formylglycine-generating enzyme required for sulfatase activity